MRMMCYSVSDRHTPKKIRVLLSGVEPKTFRLLPLSYRRLVGAKAIKLGSYQEMLLQNRFLFREFARFFFPCPGMWYSRDVELHK